MRGLQDLLKEKGGILYGKEILYHLKSDIHSSLDLIVHDNELVTLFKCEKQTNADRIRAMSDEELAKLITSGELCAICPFCKYYGTEQCYIENEGVHKNCDSGIIDWLQSEVEG